MEQAELILMKTRLETSRWLTILRRAVSAGRRAIRSNYSFQRRMKIIGRGVGGDLTLSIDRISEEAIYNSILRNAGGKDKFIFLSEEAGEIPNGDMSHVPVVICDPLDGSHNAQIGIPLFSISLAVVGIQRRINPTQARKFGDVDVGIVQSIFTDDEFLAIRNVGSFHNGSRLSHAVKVSASTSTFHTLGVECGDIDYLKRLEKNLTKSDVYKVRVIGSAALGFCFLASGSLSAFVFAQPEKARTIDSPAGYLIAREAGRAFADLDGVLSDLEEAEIGFHSRINIVGAQNKKMLSRLLEIIRPSFEDSGRGGRRRQRQKGKKNRLLN